MDREILEAVDRLKAKLRAEAEAETREAYKERLHKRNLAKLAKSSSGKTSKKQVHKKNSCPSKNTYDPSMPSQPQSIKTKDVPKKKRTDWIKGKCKLCRTEFAYLPEWRPIPVLCQGCRNERKSAYKPSKRRRGGSSLSKSYTHITVFSGGSPGGGKRR